MTTYSPVQKSEHVRRAKRATENYLGSIQRAYIQPPAQGAPAAFLLLACLLDFLGSLYAGEVATEDTFCEFARRFMPGYDGSELYQHLRCCLVHDYSVKNRFVLTHNHSNLHNRSDHGSGRTVLNLENFFNDVQQAAERYFTQVGKNPALQWKLSQSIGKRGTIEDIQLVVESTGPDEPSLVASGSAASIGR
jgi:hypothetical protein